jgi:hypothetical protein
MMSNFNLLKKQQDVVNHYQDSKNQAPTNATSTFHNRYWQGGSQVHVTTYHQSMLVTILPMLD